MVASQHGHTEAMKLLLTFPDIDVNLATVSLCPPTPSHLLLGALTLTLAMMTHHPPTHNMYPNPMNKTQCVCYFRFW